MSAILVPPGAVSAPPIFAPFFGPGFGAAPEGSLGDTINKQTEKVIRQIFDPVAAALGLSPAVVDTLSPKNTAVTSPDGGRPTPPAGGGGGKSRGAGAGDKQPGRPARLSDFKVAAKIAATGAAATGATIAVTEGLKVGAENVGQVVDNAVQKTGEYFDNLSQKVGDALTPITDPLGIKDPETKKLIGSAVVLAVVAGIVGLGILVLVKRK